MRGGVQNTAILYERRMLSFRESNLNRKRGERLLAFAEGDVL